MVNDDVSQLKPPLSVCREHVCVLCVRVVCACCVCVLCVRVRASLCGACMYVMQPFCVWSASEHEVRVDTMMTSY